MPHLPCTFRSARVVIPLCLALSCARSIAGSGASGEQELASPSVGVESQAELEIAKRQKLAQDYAPQAMQRGSAALMERDYETAYAQYKAAVDVLPDAPATRELYSIALDGFSKAVMGLAEQRIAEGRWKDAEDTVKVLLQPQYNPNYKPAQRLLARLESPDYFNKTITPGFVSRVENVKKLLLDGQGLYDSGRYDEALKKYEEVLNIDRYNIAARRGMEQVNVARTRVADAGYNDTRAAMITDVDKGWETPIRRSDLGPVAPIEQGVIDDKRSAAAIRRKLDSIILPGVSFQQATVREAIMHLQEASEKYDTTAGDGERRGVNIVLKLDPVAQNIVVDNLKLTTPSLGTALDTVVRVAGLAKKVEPYAVLIVPQTEKTEPLLTMEYRVPSGFLNIPSDSATGKSATDAKQVLIDRGIKFDTPGASATYLPSSGTLFVRNTQSNLNLVEEYLSTAPQETSSQVEITSKFVEVTQNNLKELGFDWLLGQFSLPGGSGVYGGGGTTGNQMNSVSPNAESGQTYYPFTFPGTTTPVGQNPMTAGNRTGQAAISANAVDALLLGNPVTGPAAGVLSLAGVFTNPQFQVVLRALNQKKGIDVLSAPRVTAKSGNEATVEIVREFRYPNNYDPPQIPNTTGSGAQPITPATPTEFETKNIGVSLGVRPEVGPDMYTIDLELRPIVTEFEGFINYGTPIYNRGVEVTENVINYPVFSTRKVETSVTIYDGQTVVLGGLMREDVQKVNDKTPILGDIPLAGVLFRSQADQHIKRNLIIFVTANLIDPAGQPIAANHQDIMTTEEVNETLSPALPAVEPPLPQ